MPESPVPSVVSKPEPELTGRKLGDYHLLRRLGRGGMAEVYLAEQASLRRQVAFKVLKSSLAGDENYVRRFHNEAQAAASLVHANIVQIYEVGCVDGIHFIAQEYVPGQNLKQFLDRRGPVDARLATLIMRQIAAALHKAAERGIVHRDIKPENIMLTSSGEVKVADFGLARVTSVGGSVALTQVGVTMGTPLYMSPEQVEGRSLDVRSDLYSFGVLCYHMLAGRPPFEGENALSIAVQHLKKEPERLEQLRPDLPPGLCRIVHRMLAKAPSERYPRAAELLRDLRALRIEGTDDEAWLADLEEWSAPELAAMVDARHAATQQLQAVMQSDTERLRHTRLWTLGLVLPTALFLGGFVAWATRPDPLLRIEPSERQQVQRQNTAMEQFFHALTLQSEDGWRAVWQYFPPEEDPLNQYWANQAKWRLAELHERREQYDQALALYEELSQLGYSEPQLAVSGYIGQANVYIAQGKRELAQSKLGEVFLSGLIDQLLDEPRILNTIAEEQLHKPLRPLFRQLLEELRRSYEADLPDS